MYILRSGIILTWHPLKWEDKGCFYSFDFSEGCEGFGLSVKSIG